SMVLWLLQISNSKTSLSCFVIGFFVAVMLGFSGIRKYLGSYICLSIFVFLILQMTFNIKESMILALERDTTLTGRDNVWSSVLKMTTDPLIGAGFESFWLGKRLETLWAEFSFQPNQAHNGYIETYINLGYFGLFFLGGAIFAGFRNIHKILILSSNQERLVTTEFDFGRFGMGLLITLLIYNFSEATFKGLHCLFFLFIVITIECPHVKSEMVESSASGRARGLLVSPSTRATQHGPPKAAGHRGQRGRQGS